MNKRNTKLEYVGVLSSKPSSPAYRSTFKYFNKYLITLGEPTASPNWTLLSILKHAENIIVNEKIQNGSELMIDSGGFQVITGKITKFRILEFIECYHMVLEKYPEEIQKIFSLDINNFGMTAEEILEWNYKSTEATIESIKKFPILKEKVLFVLQNRNRRVFEIWRKLFVEKRVWEHFDLYSIGGLVGLKKTTAVDFNHAVPATMWLLVYAKKYNFEIKQLHWLGQSSKVVFIAMAIMEKLFGVYFTSDSSELIRFAPIAQKLPLIRKIVAYDDRSSEFKDDFGYARTGDDVMEMLSLHSWDDDGCPRATRDNLKALDIDIDILNIVNQDLFDYLLYVNIKWNPEIDKHHPSSHHKEHHVKHLNATRSKLILDDLKTNREIVNKVMDTLLKVFNNLLLTQEDLAIIKYNLSDENLKEWNLNYIESMQDEKILKSVELQNFYLYIEKLRNFHYKNQRSKFAQAKFEESKRTRLENGDYIELMCQHIDNAILVADIVSDKIIEIGLENCTIDKLKLIHPIMDQGKTAKTIFENIGWILDFNEALEKGDTDIADNKMRDLVDSYEH